jgi:hypothetical protein
MNHPRTTTAAAEAHVLGLEPRDVAKTVVLSTPDGFLRAVLPASERLDLGKVRALLLRCAGPSGCGKTLMGLHFIFNGVRHGEPGVLATLQEHPTQLARIVEGFGWSVDEEGVELPLA